MRQRGDKVVVFCEDMDEAKNRLTELKRDAGDDQDRYLLLDPEAETAAIDKALKTLSSLEVNDSVNCVVTWQLGIRAITYWKQCYPVAWFDIKTKVDYE